MINIMAPLTNYGALPSEWELFARTPEPLQTAWLQEAVTRPTLQRVLWTDDHASLLRAWLDK
jgi:hypothetical protein